MKTKQGEMKAMERLSEDKFLDWLYQRKNMADATRDRAEAESMGDADFLRIMAVSMLKTRARLLYLIDSQFYLTGWRTTWQMRFNR